MVKTALLSLALLLAGVAGDAAAAPAGTASHADREAIAYYADWLGYRRGLQRLPGLQVAVRVGGEEALARSYGMADLERAIALDNHHLFRIASHSKTFTATAVMILAERGKLRLDDTAAQWLPWLRGRPLGGVTVAELLSHSAGVIRDADNADFWQLDLPFPDPAGLRRILSADDAATITANTHYKYSNAGFSLLGLIVEAAGGLPYNDFARREIVDRLGLRSTGPDLDRKRAPADYAVGYTGLMYADHRVPIEDVAANAMSPATGFYANASDLARFFSAHAFGEETLISDASKRRMQRPLWPDSADSRAYGLGMVVNQRGKRTLVGHSGGYPGHSSMSLLDPQRDVAVSVLINAIDGEAGECVQALFGLLDLAESATPAAEHGRDTVDLRRFTGRFARLSTVMDVALLGGRLYLISPTAPDPAKTAMALKVVDRNTLRLEGGSGGNPYGEPLVYEFAAGGDIESVRLGVRYVPIDKFKLPGKVVLKQ
ncbi:MAG TPA: serine hydrolase [Xanthomonadaceae bacterium]|nr:serine hydrolase [Xanthomonadaceae bacterium]